MLIGLEVGHTQSRIYRRKDSITKKKLRRVAVDQEYVELAAVLIIVYPNTSRCTNRYGLRGRDIAVLYVVPPDMVDKMMSPTYLTLFVLF